MFMRKIFIAPILLAALMLLNSCGLVEENVLDTFREASKVMEKEQDSLKAANLVLLDKLKSNEEISKAHALRFREGTEIHTMVEALLAETEDIRTELLLAADVNADLTKKDSLLNNFDADHHITNKVMIKDGRATLLKKRIDALVDSAYRLKSFNELESAEVKEAITLNTSVPEQELKTKGKENWETYRFENTTIFLANILLKKLEMEALETENITLKKLNNKPTQAAASNL